MATETTDPLSEDQKRHKVIQIYYLSPIALPYLRKSAFICGSSLFLPLRLCGLGRRSPVAAGGEMGRPVRRGLRDYRTKEETCFA